ncbi:peptide/nickel transport system permease protein [Mycobacterium sp. OAS707]|uniref:ABC transporter permease n=1 Tax=unclassified Mycobacterium TaxID=2642494 RepID=UPI001788F479|nr:ABC transporter permease [Mycobacterium sp. OAS707]MBE1551812.1 peptide/nickel transport system permease protein [Mycobacterium sp. OAS707]
MTETLQIATAKPSGRSSHPIRSLVVSRAITGVISIFVISIIVYAATLVLPGDAATAILGQQATPERLAALRAELHLDQSPITGYFNWVTSASRGDFGKSLTQGLPVWDIVGPRLANSMVLIALTAIISTILGVLLGMWAAARRDSWIDHSLSVSALVASALPEFVIAVFVVMVFAVTIFAWFPAVSILPEGEHIWNEPVKLVLPVFALVLVVTPYVFRMFRASLIEALNSDYVEVATLKGASMSRLLFGHALPNALAATIQVVGLNLLYLAGGIALVETVFQFPGIGLALVAAISERDVPMIQFLVVLLAIAYVLLNITTDLAVLLVTPRKRLPR